MTPEREHRVLDAFDAYVGSPETQREALLAELLDHDLELIDAVHALLAAERDVERLPTEPEKPVTPGPEAPPPERIGAYRLSALIGRGGMGGVYRGERIEGGFDQSVAIKLIRSGLFTNAAARQFAQERQILARLHHPHITQLFDGGLTSEGQPYIVMELVAGASITDHSDGASLPLEARLDLFADVCSAIAYAHSQGVVHADIKPANIVTDPRHGVKLLDFGISSLVGGVESVRRAATPGFASPQQLAHAPPSPADDIFALGMLLRILCADQTGYDSELAAVAARASAALPADRYDSVEALASDMMRWRRRKPVHAMPARLTRTLWFFWRRNRLAISLWTAASLALVLAVIIMTALYLHADAERRQAVQRFTEVRALSRYMLNDLTTTLEQFPGTAPLRGQLAQKGRVYLEGLSRIPDPPADVRLEVAKGYAKTGDVVTRLGKQNSADPRAGATDLAQAETRLRALRVSNPNDDVTLALAQVLISRAGLALTADNQPKLASTHLVEACRLSTALETVRPSWFDAKMAHIACLSGQANIADFEGRFAEVMAITDDALAEVNRLPSGDDPVIAALAKAKLLNLQGDAQYYLDSKPKALIALIKAANVLDAARHVRADVRLFDQIAMTTYNIASTLEDLGRRREELTWIDRGVAAADEMRAFEDSPHAWRTVNIVHLQRATTLASLGRFREAMVEAEANIAVRRTIAARSPNDNLAVRALPVGLRPLGDIYWKAGRKQKACRAYTEAQQLWDRLGKQGGVLGSDRGGEIVLVAGKVHTCDLAEISSGRG